MHINPNHLSFWNTTKAQWIFMSCALAYMLMVSFQGFDVCDEGWVLSVYQQILQSPETVEYNFLYWLSSITGGIWYHIFPEGGILWFRILAIIVTLLIFRISFMILKTEIPPLLIGIGLWMALWVQDYGMLVFHHNHLSSLLSIAALLFMIKGLQKSKTYLILISGIVIGVNVLTRLPNITLLGYIILIPFYYWINKEPVKKGIPALFWYVLGFGIGIALLYLSLLLLDQTTIMKNALQTIFRTGGEQDSNHNVTGLLKTYIQNYKLVVYRSIPIIAGLSLCILGMVYTSKRIMRVLLIVSGLGLSIYFLKDADQFMWYGLGFLGILIIIISKATPYLKTIALSAALTMILLPLGSDQGIHNMGYYTLWLAIPITISVLVNLKNIQLSFFKKQYELPKSDTLKGFKIVLFIVGIAYLGMQGNKISNQAYFDPGSRLEKSYAIHDPRAKGIYTSQERASIINAVLPVIRKHVKKGEYLLAYDNIPMVHFLTETKPYMYIPWIWVYDSGVFKDNIKRAEESQSKLPVVLLQKFNTLGKFSKPSASYFSIPEKDTYVFKKRRIEAMQSFLVRNQYEIIWSNAYFDILKPKH